MKKLAIGCFAILVLAGALVVGVGYYGYTRVRSTVTQFAELGRVPEIERDVRIKAPFTAPPTGELTAAQVDRFMTVQSRVRERLGSDLALFERNYKTLADKKQTTVGDLPQLMSAYKDLAATWLSAKRAQVAALNDVGLSLGEYRWIRSEAYRSLGIPLVDIDFGRIAEQVRAGAQPESTVLVGGALTGPGPASNLKLVERFRKQLEANMPLASFGL